MSDQIAKKEWPLLGHEYMTYTNNLLFGRAYYMRNKWWYLEKHQVLFCPNPKVVTRKSSTFS